MKYVPIKLRREELVNLYHYHTDIADDVLLSCHTKSDEKTLEERRARANKIKKMLAKEFRYKL